MRHRAGLVGYEPYYTGSVNPKTAKSQAFPLLWNDVRIVEVALGDSAPALGAAAVAADAFK